MPNERQADCSSFARAPSAGPTSQAAANSSAVLARMSGSGATCFALFDQLKAAAAAARTLRAQYPQWWVRAAILG